MKEQPEHQLHFVVVDRHLFSRFCFYVSGALATFLFAGVMIWAQSVVVLFLALACWYESTVAAHEPTPFPWILLIGITLLLGWTAITLIPWPARWAPWLAPGQERLLQELDGFRPRFLHLTLAPHATWGALGTLLGALAVLFLSWRWSGDTFFRQNLQIFLLVLGVLAAALGILDRMDGGGLLGEIRAEAAPGYWGAFTNRNHFANELNVAALVGLGLALRLGFAPNPKHRSLPGSLTALIGTLLCIGTSVGTSSKGGLLSLGVGLLVFGVLLFFQRKSSLQLKILVFALLAILALVMVQGRPSLQRIESWVHNSRAGHMDGRWQIWQDTLRMAEMMRGRGIGAGAFETVFPAFQTTLGHKTVTHPENEYLQAWAEWGVVGSAIWGVLALAVIWRAARTFRGHASEWQVAGWSAVAATGTHALTDFPFHIPANLWLLCALLGMLLRGHLHNGKDPAPTPHAHRWRLFDLWVFRMLGAALIAATVAGFLAPWSHLNEATKLLRQGDLAAARPQCARALAAWPFYWRAHQLTAYAAVDSAPIREVQRHLWHAQRLAQANATISFGGGELFLKSHPALARDFFATAISISDLPVALYTRTLELASASPDLVPMMLRTAPPTLEFWMAGWQALQARPLEALRGKWLDEAEAQWIDDPAQRGPLLRLFYEQDRGDRVLASLSRNPPATSKEFYWKARILQKNNPKDACALYEEIWSRKNALPPVFASDTEVTDATRSRAVSDPSNLVLQYKLAAAMMQRSLFAEAVPVWRRILGQTPEDSLARYGLAMALEQSGDWSKSAEAWRALAESALPPQ